jgi:hypothetical protein
MRQRLDGHRRACIARASSLPTFQETAMSATLDADVFAECFETDAGKPLPQQQRIWRQRVRAMGSHELAATRFGRYRVVTVMSDCCEGACGEPLEFFTSLMVDGDVYRHPVPGPMGAARPATWGKALRLHDRVCRILGPALLVRGDELVPPIRAEPPEVRDDSGQDPVEEPAAATH